MTDYIRIQHNGIEYAIPNRWELIRPEYEFTALVKDLFLMSMGKLSPAMVRIRYVARFFDWDLQKIKDEEALANLAMLGEQITFIFRISYPDNDAALSELDDYTYRLCKMIPPERLHGITIARALQRLDYKFTVNLCFCRQFIGAIRLEDSDILFGYTIDTSFGMLSTSLTALQFIEAKQLIGKDESFLPLLAAILYYPGTYNSEAAHQLATRIKAEVDIDTLRAISLNFQAFVNYLFTRTEYRLLTAAREVKSSPISTGALESLYNLSRDGLGDIRTVEQMGVLQYLTILRKKIIESVRQLHAAKMELVDIELETGLPLHIIKQILS